MSKKVHIQFKFSVRLSNKTAQHVVESIEEFTNNQKRPSTLTLAAKVMLVFLTITVVHQEFTDQW